MKNTKPAHIINKVSSVGEPDCPVPAHLFYGTAEFLARFGHFDFVVIVGLKDKEGIQGTVASLGNPLANTKKIRESLDTFISQLEQHEKSDEQVHEG